ncbi:MAG TPA: LCP family protein [Actinotalea sp.]|nr:LCP family protein [Actinotalea sp.]
MAPARQRPPATPPPAPGTAGAPGTGARRGRHAALVGLLVLALLLAWPAGLARWADGRLTRVPALSGAAGTTGTTYLLAGSDARGDGAIPEDGTQGARTDTIMVLHVPPSGPAALISLPRDTYAEIPGYGAAKLNASFSVGGPALLVQTVEGLTGLTVDHYVEVGFAGVEGVVEAVGGVELCLDYDVNEPLSGLVWTAGCAVADGPTALAFARMRYADPEGDIGRAKRQQQLIGAITSQVAQPSLLIAPGRQVSLLRAGTDALAVSDGTSVIDLARLALAFRAASGPAGVTGTPPIANPDYRPGDIGSTVLLDPDLSPAFWAAITDGTLPAGPVGGLPTAG